MHVCKTAKFEEGWGLLGVKSYETQMSNVFWLENAKSGGCNLHLKQVVVRKIEWREKWDNEWKKNFHKQ